jgi:Na+-driven multidrug efflux pump
MLVVFTSATAIAARIDKPTLAAHQVTNTMFSLLALVLDALAIPAHTMMAEALGAADHEAAVRTGRRVVRLSLYAGIAVAALLAATSWLVARVFSHDDPVISRTTVGLLVLALVLVPGGVAFGLDGVLIGAGDYKFLGRAAAGELLGFLPFGLLALAVPGLGIGGVWGALGLWMVVRAIVKYQRFVRGHWALVPAT